MDSPATAQGACFNLVSRMRLPASCHEPCTGCASRDMSCRAQVLCCPVLSWPDELNALKQKTVVDSENECLAETDTDRWRERLRESRDRSDTIPGLDVPVRVESQRCCRVLPCAAVGCRGAGLGRGGSGGHTVSSSCRWARNERLWQTHQKKRMSGTLQNPGSRVRNSRNNVHVQRRKEGKKEWNELAGCLLQSRRLKGMSSVGSPSLSLALCPRNPRLSPLA